MARQYSNGFVTKNHGTWRAVIDYQDGRHTFQPSRGTVLDYAIHTILDLVLDGEDPSLVADALADAAGAPPGRPGLDPARLEELFLRNSGRWGVPVGALDGLAADAGIDLDGEGRKAAS